MNNKTTSSEPGERVLSEGSYLVKKESMVPFFLLLSYLFLEYARPQDLLPFLRVLRLPAITLILLALSFIIIPRKIQLRDQQTTLFFILLGLMVIHGPIAVNNYWALMIFLNMTMNFIVFLSLIRYVDTPDKYGRLIKVWLGIHMILAIIGIVKSGKGIGGFLGDENDLCMTMNMILPFSFFLAMNESGGKRIYYIILTCLFLFVIILTQSRGGFVGLVATGMYCWLRTKRKVFTGLIIGLLAVFVFLTAPPTYWDEVRSIGEEGASKGTGAERVYTWGIGWHMFLDNPVMGVGQGNFNWVFKKYEFIVTGSDEPFHGRSVAGRAAHSAYFTLLPELGLIGVILFLWMVYAIIKDLKYIKRISLNNNKEDRTGLGAKYYHLSLALEGSLIAYLVSGVFISILYYPNFWIFMGFVMSLKRIVMRKGNKLPPLSNAIIARNTSFLS